MALDSDPVMDDPFFGVVRRRHPDVDIVLLPPERAALDGPPGEDEHALGALAFATVAERDLAELDARARDCTGAHPLVQESDEGWVASSDGGLSRRRLFAAYDVVPEEGIRLIVAGSEALELDGWRVRRPSTGQARFLADRGPLSLHVVHVPAAQRLAVITHAGAYSVEPDLLEGLVADRRRSARHREGDDTGGGARDE